MITNFKLFESKDYYRTITNYVETYIVSGDMSEIDEYILRSKQNVKFHKNTMGIGLVRSYTNITLMQKFLDEGADINFYKDGFTNVLTWAVHNNEYKSVKFLLENGADPNQDNKVTNGNIFKSINYGQGEGESDAELEMFRLLLDYDANGFFEEFLTGKYVDIIMKEYPEKYDKYLFHKELNNFGI